MMRRRPIARMAVRTTAIAGTAAVVGGHMANKQAAAQAAQGAPEPQYAPAPQAPPRPDRAVDPPGCAEGLGCAHGSRVRGAEGQAAGLGRLTLARGHPDVNPAALATNHDGRDAIHSR